MRFLSLITCVVGNEVYFDQILDHFSSNVSTTFQQRYYVNDVYYEKGGPAFIYIGGESAFNEKRLMDGMMADLAQEHRGVIYGLEHRYYGKSHPFPELSVANLKYLSSDQALEDLVYFASKESPHHPSKWFLIGGSYGGTLAAWGRQKYPRVFHGALASSAPVLAKADFYEFDEMVAKSLGNECHSSVNKLIAYLDDVYEQGDLGSIKKMFNCTKIQDDILFLSMAADVIANIVLHESQFPLGINEVCSQLNSVDSEKERLTIFLDIFSFVLERFGRSGHEFTYFDEIKSQIPTEHTYFRQWIYQACQEFGFWQTASKLPMRSKYLTFDWFNSFYCGSTFFNPAIGPPNTDLTNSKNKGKELNASNIMFTHGEKDPWSALSYTKGNSIIISNGSHCNDMYPEIYNSYSFSETKVRIKDTFRAWIGP
ncbi:hypothetical protein DSO57_1009900 [Entomophthora muscae]|uniref:Uncharacterized protein n=1 Tax=Entomophthora muscae TaxID=34485 RepID=A0ACC2U4F8_9FUNG|nr:hypothetical protein DSO57_1009900 [Entomophthora muscae]